MKTDNINTILNKVKSKVIPSKQEKEKLLTIANEIISKLKKEFDDVRLLGSIAKDTFIKGSTDLDIFVFFDEGIDKAIAGKKLIDFCKSNFGKVEIAYAEHPYARVFYKHVRADIVPAYKGKQLKSAVDRTPYHAKFINKHLTLEQKNDVRILKAFLKAFDIYGAEIKIQGFSGYLAELLIAKYGNFINVLKNASKWKKPTIITFGNDKGYKEFNEPLIVIDPTDEHRNVASSLSLTNFALFILASRAFLKRPSLDFFYPKVKGYDGNFITLALESPNVTKDIKYGQLKRIARALRHYLQKYDFVPIRSFVEDLDKSFIILELADYNTNPLKVMHGPLIYNATHLNKFIKASKKSFINGDIIYKIKEREQNIESYVKSFINQYAFTKHYKKSSILSFYMGIPTEIKHKILKRIYLENLVFSILSES